VPSDDASRDFVAPWSRVAILVAALAVGAFLSWRLTGSIVPTEPEESLIFQSGLLLIVLGSAVLEHKFTRPADSVVNALTGIVTLVTVYAFAPRLAWLSVFSYCALVFLLALICTAVSTGPEVTGWKERVANLTYQPAVYLGRARLLHSVIFLFGVFVFYDSGSREAAVLVAFWGVFIALWPLRLPQLLSGLSRSQRTPSALGRVIRREWPDLVRIELRSGVDWSQEKPRIYQDGDGEQHLVVPLYKQLRDQQAIATGLCVSYEGRRRDDLVGGFVYELGDTAVDVEGSITQSLRASPGSQLLGFVVEDSEISAIRFETWRPNLCREGLLVSCAVADKKVFYQITQGTTREETLQADRLGFQVGVAAQMGMLDHSNGFVNCDWLPTMNTPVFAESQDFGSDLDNVHKGDFVYGKVPGTNLRVGGPFTQTLDFHTAILGVTGSGKTELAFDLIRHSVGQGVKVVCIDLTKRYEGRLKDLDPRNLSLSAETAKELGDKLFDVETGAWGAKDEKRILKELTTKLHADVSSKIEEFLTSDEDDARVGLITLDEISNTQATLVVTEMYMTCLLNYARDNPDSCPHALVVVEEAHTVMPETSAMGIGGYDARGLVSKISQIALQGRKYGIGLLVIAQRTATVSKTVLTQCNTVIALNSFDETTAGFLSNVYGRAHADALRDLPQLHAVVFGKGVRSQRPIIVQIPYDPEKDPDGSMSSSPDEALQDESPDQPAM
jgi:hypothetical protein